MAESVSAKECGFCLRKAEDMEEPKLLPCTHVHCLSCLKMYFDKNDIVTCLLPLCRSACEVPLNSLPTYELSGDESFVCDVCVKKQMSKQPAVIYCINCSRTFCSNHQQSHDDVLSDHSMLAIDEYRTQARKLEIWNCSKHVDQPYSMGCQACLNIICVECTVNLGNCSNGNSHQLVAFKDLVNIQLEDAINAHVLTKEDRLERLFKRASKVSTEYDNKTTEFIEVLHKIRDKQPNHLKSMYDQLEVELLQKRQEKRIELSEFMEENVLTKLTELRSCRLSAESHIRSGHEVDIVRGYREIRSQMLRLTEDGLPKLKLKGVVEMHKSGLETNSILEIVILDGLFIDLGPPKLLEKLVEVHVQSPIGVCLHKATTFVLSGLAIEFINSEFQLDTAPEQLFEEPLSIVAHKDNLYVLTFDSVVTVYDTSGSWQSEWTIDGNDYLGDVLTFVCDQLLVPDHIHLRFVFYSPDGKVVKRVSCEQLMEPPSAMCAIDDTSVIITQSSCVSRVDITSGETLWRCDDVKEPSSLCCYEGGYALVGSSADQISVLDIRTGKVVSELADGAIAKEPIYGMDVAGTTLAVTQTDNDRVIFFDMY